MAKVLVVDDDPTSLELATILVEREGHTVLRAPDGRTALRVLRDTAVDLIVTDIMMPEVDGFSVVQLARQVQPNALVVVMSAIGDRVPSHMTEAAWQALRVDWVLSKPYRATEFQRVVRALIR